MEHPEAREGMRRYLWLLIYRPYGRKISQRQARYMHASVVAGTPIECLPILALI